jgi:hypothetical protein
MLRHVAARARRRSGWGVLVRRKLLVLALAYAAVPLLAGCAFLDDPAFDDGFGAPLATYVTGRATLEIDGRTIVLDRLSAGPHLIQGAGADVYWYNEEGWGLRLSAFDMLGAGATNISIDRVRTTYWSADGYEDCLVKVETADETGVKGSATCDGLRWVDRLRGASSWGEGPGYVEGEPAFDATVVFEARPALGTPTSTSPGATPGAAAS